MTIYVDDLFTMTPRSQQARSHGNEWCHMVTDSADLEELHLMAEKIGLKRAYFQPHATLPHYDLIPSKRVLAIRYGAVAISAQELVKKNFEAHKPKGDETTLRAKNIPSPDLDNAYEQVQVIAKAEAAQAQPSVKDFWNQSPDKQYQLKKKAGK